MSDTHAASPGPYRKYNPGKKPKVTAPRVTGEYSSSKSKRPPAPSKRKEMIAALASFGTRRT